jgi:hypothetical protein
MEVNPDPTTLSDGIFNSLKKAAFACTMAKGLQDNATTLEKGMKQRIAKGENDGPNYLPILPIQNKQKEAYLGVFVNAKPSLIEIELFSDETMLHELGAYGRVLKSPSMSSFKSGGILIVKTSSPLPLLVTDSVSDSLTDEVLLTESKDDETLFSERFDRLKILG